MRTHEPSEPVDIATEPQLRPLPDPLPRPLSDPLRYYRWLVLVVLLLLWAIQWLTPRVRPPTVWEHVAAVDIGVTFAVFICAYIVLPRRVTNAIYLRSFRNDAGTGRLRAVAQEGLGREFRLSGIRDPRRRWPWLVRHLVYVLFLIQYARPRYMNLEAGDDWKARLWRSLGDARCVLIDVTDLTPFVCEEVELAVNCLGLRQVLFVTDDSRTEAEWRRAIRDILQLPHVPADRIQTAVWSDRPTGRTAFKKRVQDFADQLPKVEPDINASAFPHDPSGVEPDGSSLRHNGRLEFLLATLVGSILALTLNQIAPTSAAVAVATTAAFAYTILSVGLLIGYVAECASLRRRLRVGAAFALASAFALFPPVSDLIAPRATVSDHADQLRSGNNLKQIGMALYAHESIYQRSPPVAVCRPDGIPLLSWRVMLLPELDQEALFQQFKLDEPWDGPHNIQLLEKIPPVYRSPYRSSNGGPTDTHYQALIGPETVWNRPRPAGRSPRVYVPRWPATSRVTLLDAPFRLAELDGTDVVLVVEAADPVPWTKPADLEYVPAARRSTPDEMTRKLGATRFGFNVLLADGSVRHGRVMSPTDFDALVVGTSHSP